jgi:hypothetical protein
MGQSRVLAHLNFGVAFKPLLAVRSGHKVGKIMLRHTLLKRVVGCGVGGQCHPGCQSHEFDLVLAFYHAAAGCDRRSAGDASLHSSQAYPVAENEGRVFPNS